MNLEEMRRERDRLNAEIAAEEKLARDSWNDALTTLQLALKNWLRDRSIEAGARERKNAEIWDIGHGALEVTFVFYDDQYGPGTLQMISGRGGQRLRLEWDHVPEQGRFLDITAAVLGRSKDAEKVPLLTGDECHVLLDVLNREAAPALHPAPWSEYYDADPDDDPKATEAGWNRLRHSAEEKISRTLGISD